mmetsp:Transcript_79985/g.208595  ORF Transcript_79985/g.208595 Transcript_79985/m.208595 type:complete len:313 (+) Transcript_79985:68-1006(+)
MEQDPDALFQALSLLALPAYPLAVYATWSHPLVDHEVPPLRALAPALPEALAMYGAGLLFRRAAGPALLRLRKRPSGLADSAEAKAADLANERRYLARAWKMVELALLSALGLCVLGTEPFFPASLGGQGDVAALLPAGRRRVPWALAAYHAARFAYLLEWWVFEDGLQRPYLTMHHIATSIVLCCAVFAGWTQFGGVIILLHDASGVPIQLLVWMQQVHVPALALIAVYFVNLYVWARYMLYVFPFEVIMPSLTSQNAESMEWRIYWSMFVLLLVHHVYTYLRLLAYVPKFLKSPAGAVAAAQTTCEAGRD